jgi:hypothetical protein
MQSVTKPVGQVLVRANGIDGKIHNSVWFTQLEMANHYTL